MSSSPANRARLLPLSVLVVALATVAAARPAHATDAWPGEAWPQAVDLTALDSDFGRNLSGAHWNPVTRTLWVCLNAPGKFWALVEDGAGSFRVASSGGTAAEWSPGGDLEAITQVDLTESAVYVLNEAGSLVSKYDTTVYGKVTLLRQWNLGPFLPTSGGAGAEGLAFVPDEWLLASGFVDGSGAPYTSRHGMGGLVFVAHQNGGSVYAFDLGASDATVELVGEYKTSRGESSGLEFDRSSGKLYIWHNTGSNYLELTDLRSYLRADGKRQFYSTREYLGPKTGNLEGVALTPAADGDPWYFATDDDCQNGVALMWFRSFRPAQVGPDAYAVEQGGTLTVPAPGVRANDSGPALAARLVTAPTEGWLTGLLPGQAFDGGFQYAPGPGFTGTDSFTYKADDGVAGSEVTTVTITVLPRAPLEVAVTSGADDVEENATGRVTTNSSDLELVQESTAQVVGIRFAAVDLPPRAVVRRAWLQFTADEAGSTGTSLVIQAVAADAAAPFTTAAWGVSGRARTAARVTWTPAAWTTVNAAGTEQRSPDLAGVVQEIVDRPGWAEGNSLAFVVTGAGRRTGRAFEANAALAPRLHVEFDDPPPLPAGPTVAEARVASGSDDAEESATGAVNLTSTDLELVQESSAQTVGIRFAALDVPNDVIVTAAWLQFTTDEPQSVATTLAVKGELSAAAAPYTTASRNISTRPRTGAWVEWLPAAWPTTGESGAAQRSPDLSDVVQEIVDTPGWARGNPIAFVVSGSGKRVARAWNGSPAGAPLLHVEYVELGPPETLEVRIAASTDDAEESATGGVSLTSTDLELVQESSVQTVGLRFASVAVPTGSRVSAAWLQFKVDEATSGSTTLVIQGEASPTPRTFGTTARDLSARARTSVDVVWTPPAWTPVGAAGAGQRSPDLAEVVQELLDQDGWQSGGALSFLVTGAGKRVAESRDKGAGGAPLLHLEFRRPVVPIGGAAAGGKALAQPEILRPTATRRPVRYVGIPSSFQPLRTR